MGKSKKRNAFFHFMMEKKSEQEKKLNRKVTMAELNELLSPQWQALPETSKNKYRMMCGQGRELLDCRGVPLRQLEEEICDQRRQMESMKKDITDLVELFYHGKALHHITFYIVSTNYYVLTDYGHYVPAELSILQFNLEEGILREFHDTVCSFTPPSYHASAKQHSQSTHKLLEHPDKSPGVDMYDVAQNLKHFLSTDWKGSVPFYTLDTEIVQAMQILNTITGNKYKVYSLDMLYQHIYSSAVCNIPMSVAGDMITDCGLDYYPNLSCKWHISNQMDAARYCSLSIVRRWSYFMCQHIDIKSNFGVVPRKGKHYPCAALEEDGMQNEMSHLTLEDRDSVVGAVGFDSTTVMAHKDTLSARSRKY